MILVALGANLPGKFGDPASALKAAVKAVRDAGLKVTGASRIWLTAPVPVSDQPWYHNAVIRLETALPPQQLLARLQAIETAFGRVRHIRNEPRVLDLDLLIYHDLVMNEPDLILPHPRMQERGFVLLPLREIAPDWQHPCRPESLDAMIAALPDEQQARPGEILHV